MAPSDDDETPEQQLADAEAELEALQPLLDETDGWDDADGADEFALEHDDDSDDTQPPEVEDET